HVAALHYLERNSQSLAVNLGSGTGTSVKEILDAVEKVSGQRVPRRIVPRRPGDPPALVADPSKAESVLHWKTQRSLEQIVATAWKWKQSQQTSKTAGS